MALAYAESDNLANIIPTLVFTALLSYFVASMFVEVFGMAISSILVCYIADEEMFPPEDRFCDGPLRGAIKKTAQKASDTQVVPVQPIDEKVRTFLTLMLFVNLLCRSPLLKKPRKRMKMDPKTKFYCKVVCCGFFSIHVTDFYYCSC